MASVGQDDARLGRSHITLKPFPERSNLLAGTKLGANKSKVAPKELRLKECMWNIHQTIFVVNREKDIGHKRPKQHPSLAEPFSVLSPLPWYMP